MPRVTLLVRASRWCRILTEQQLLSSGSMEFENKGTLHRHVSDRRSKKLEEFLHRDDESSSNSPSDTPSGEKDKGGNDVIGAALFFCPTALFLLSALLGSWHNTRRAQ